MSGCPHPTARVRVLPWLRQETSVRPVVDAGTSPRVGELCQYVASVKLIQNVSRSEHVNVEKALKGSIRDKAVVHDMLDDLGVNLIHHPSPVRQCM